MSVGLLLKNRGFTDSFTGATTGILDAAGVANIGVFTLRKRFFEILKIIYFLSKKLKFSGTISKQQKLTLYLEREEVTYEVRLRNDEEFYTIETEDNSYHITTETDDPARFLDLVEELRSSEARPYTLRDTPIFTCVNKPLKACLDDLG